jgi:hypothetical protein
MYGYEDLARLARSVEQALKQPAEPGRDTLARRVQALIAAIDGLEH